MYTIIIILYSWLPGDGLSAFLTVYMSFLNVCTTGMEIVMCSQITVHMGVSWTAYPFSMCKKYLFILFFFFFLATMNSWHTMCQPSFRVAFMPRLSYYLSRCVSHAVSRMFQGVSWAGCTWRARRGTRPRGTSSDRSPNNSSRTCPYSRSSLSRPTASNYR